MSSSDPLLQLELMVAAEFKGTWDTHANNVFTQIAESRALRVTKTFTNADITLTDTAKASNESRSAVLVAAGTLTGSANLIIPNRTYDYILIVTVVFGAFTLGIKTASGSAQPLSNGIFRVICDGSNAITLIRQDGDNYGETSGTDTYTVSVPHVPATFYKGWSCTVKFGNANTGAVTLNPNSSGAKTVVKSGGTALTAGDIPAGMVGKLVWDGTNLQLFAAKVAATLALSDGGTKTSSFSAASNTRYIAEGSGITATGPASATAQDVLVLAVGATGIIFNPNGLKANGSTGTVFLDPFTTHLFTYTGSTSGWC